MQGLQQARKMELVSTAIKQGWTGLQKSIDHFVARILPIWKNVSRLGFIAVLLVENLRNC
jgi:hypothetical protein